jgi:hypothetical protein
MDDYPYTTLGGNVWFRCDELHYSGFPTLLWDVLHRFGYTGTPVYHGHPYRQFGLGHCIVPVDILAYPTDPTMTAWFTMARGDDLDNTLERAADQALTEFCEHHLPVLGDTAIALLPIQNEDNAVWSERVAAVGNPELRTHHAGWAFMARYSQHVSSLLQEVIAMGTHLRLHLEEWASQVKAKNRTVKEIQKGNRELLQKNTCLDTRVKELNDEPMRTCRRHDFRTDDLNDSHTQLQHAQDELIATQSYIHHLKTELHGRDEQLEVSQAQTAELQHEVEHLQELFPSELEEPEETEGMSGVEDNSIVHVVRLSRIP